jgi:AAA15 family ATPase/GTPase
MRLAELTLERYGAFAERSLVIPSTAGLTVIYGPNEAGKSTCLAALSDFLFGIPERSAQNRHRARSSKPPRVSKSSRKSMPRRRPRPRAKPSRHSNQLVRSPPTKH